MCVAFVTGHFNIYTREAGAGGLSIAVEGPSKAEIDFQDHKDGSCEVAYTCTEPGGLSHVFLSDLTCAVVNCSLLGHAEPFCDMRACQKIVANQSA